MAIVLTFLIAMLLCVITLMVINCMLGMCHTLCKPWMARHCGSGSSTSGSSTGAVPSVVNASYSLPIMKTSSGISRQPPAIMLKGKSTFQTIWITLILIIWHELLLMEKVYIVNYNHYFSVHSATFISRPRNGNGYSVNMLNRYFTCCDYFDVYKLYIRHVSHLL